ncbi:MAG: LPS biosynthesis protein WbpP, partial [Actinomycetota bacterium]
NEVYRSLCEVVGVDIDPLYVPKRTGDIRHSYADISAAKALLKWEPRAEWKAAVRSTVEWFQ